MLNAILHSKYINGLLWHRWVCIQISWTCSHPGTSDVKSSRSYLDVLTSVGCKHIPRAHHELEQLPTFNAWIHQLPMVDSFIFPAQMLLQFLMYPLKPQKYKKWNLNRLNSAFTYPCLLQWILCILACGRTRSRPDVSIYPQSLLYSLSQGWQHLLDHSLIKMAGI